MLSITRILREHVTPIVELLLLLFRLGPFPGWCPSLRLCRIVTSFELLSFLCTTEVDKDRRSATWSRSRNDLRFRRSRECRRRSRRERRNGSEGRISFRNTGEEREEDWRITLSESEALEKVDMRVSLPVRTARLEEGRNLPIQRQPSRTQSFCSPASARSDPESRILASSLPVAGHPNETPFR